MSVQEGNGTFPDPNLENLGRALLAAEVKNLVILNGQTAEDGDPFSLATPAGFRTEVDRVASEFLGQPVGGARAQWVRDLLEGDQVECQGVQAPSEQGPSLLPAGEVVEDVDGGDTEGGCHDREDLRTAESRVARPAGWRTPWPGSLTREPGAIIAVASSLPGPPARPPRS